METEPVAPHQSMSSFNPFSQHQFNQQQQEHHQMMLLQQQQQQQQQQLISQHQQQNQQVDEEMEMADDNTCDMKYSENDMNVTNSQQQNHLQQQSHLQQLHKNQQEQQLLQQIHSAQISQQQQQQQQQQQFNAQKFGRLDNQEFAKKEKLLEDESYDEDEDYDDEEDDLDDYDEHLVQEMMLSAAPEVQNIIKLIISGFSACATETLRYLVEEENLGVNSPLMVGLIDHLKTQETMLIVNCLRTQQYQAQLIKQHQQQILASQLLGKQVDPKMIDPKLLSQLVAANQSPAVNEPTSQQMPSPLHGQQAQQPQLKGQHKKTVAPSSPQSMLSQQQQQQLLGQQQQKQQAAQPTNHSSSSNQRLAGHLTNGAQRLPNNLNGLNAPTGGSLSPNHVPGPLTSSPINKPFEQLNSINVNNVNNQLNHLSNFNSTLHSAFGGSSSQNSSAQNSQSNSPIHTPPLHLQNGGGGSFSSHPHPFSGQAGFGNGNGANFGGQSAFFNQTSGILSSFKPPFNDSGFSE